LQFAKQNATESRQYSRLYPRKLEVAPGRRLGMVPAKHETEGGFDPLDAGSKK
jgi:hypothetical protein